MTSDQDSQPGDAQVWLEAGLILVLAVGMWHALQTLVAEMTMAGAAGFVVGGIVSVPSALGLLGWRLGEYERRERARARKRAQDEQRLREQQQAYERQLQRQAEEVGASLPISVLKSFEQAGLEWQPIVRAVHQQPESVARVCDTDLAAIGPYEFEEWTAELFRVFGWSASATQPGRDRGVDVFIEKRGFKAIVQCKRHQAAIGGPDARQLLGSLVEQNVDKAFLVTTSTFTPDARDVAAASKGRLELVPGSCLSGWVGAVRKVKAQTSGEAPVSEAVGEKASLSSDASSGCASCVLALIGLWVLAVIMSGIGLGVHTVGWRIDIEWAYNGPALTEQHYLYPDYYYYPIWVRVTNNTTATLDLHPDAFHIMMPDGTDCGGWGNSTDVVRAPLKRRDLAPGRTAQGNIAIDVPREHASNKFRIRYEGPRVADQSVVAIRKYSPYTQVSSKQPGPGIIWVVLVLVAVMLTYLLWRLGARSSPTAR